MPKTGHFRSDFQTVPSRGNKVCVQSMLIFRKFHSSRSRPPALEIYNQTGCQEEDETFLGWNSNEFKPLSNSGTEK